jgi:glycosyltransferase involved in cell wall biosynthesis
MKVSIITPSFNSAAFIKRCILSVQNQQYQDLEHIIVDGCSKDKTMDVVREFGTLKGLLAISEKDKGIADAMNKGFKLATGDVFAWLDADNYYSPGIIQEVVDIFNSNQAIEIVYGNINVVNDKDESMHSYKPPNVLSFKGALVKTTGAIPPQPAVFFKRSIFEKAGGFDISYKVAGDYDFWLKVLKVNPSIHYYDRVFGSYYSAGNTASQSIGGVIKGFKEMSLIGKKNGQPLFGRIVMFLKYFKGYIGSLRCYLKK